MATIATPTTAMAVGRRGCILLSLTFTLLVLLLAAPAGAHAIGEWTVQTSGTDADLHSVAFVDAQHGWAVGNAAGGTTATIVATSDSGASWHAQTTLQNGQPSVGLTYLNDVTFADATHGWAVGCYWTGGPPWTVTPLIVATTNGGTTWETQDAGSVGALTAVAFVNASQGWAVGTGGTILVTSNGGTTWQTQSLGSAADLSDVAFADAAHGWAVGTGGTILVTSNGGTSWQTQDSGTVYNLNAVAAADVTHGWVTGDWGTVLATSNGGSIWSDCSIGQDPDYSGYGFGPIAFANASDGWVVGYYMDGFGSGVFTTRDGGATWREQESASSSDRQFGIAFTSTVQGWLVGQDGAVLATTNGGDELPLITRGTAGGGTARRRSEHQRPRLQRR